MGVGDYVDPGGWGLLAGLKKNNVFSSVGAKAPQSVVKQETVGSRQRRCGFFLCAAGQCGNEARKTGPPLGYTLQLFS